MKAGRELDALTAEKVMGLRVVRCPDHGDCIYWHAYGPDRPDGQLPEYSTDIAEAWQVVEKLRDLDPEIWWDVHWECVFNTNDSRVWGTADTAPEAICRAALAAVGCEVPA